MNKKQAVHKILESLAEKVVSFDLTKNASIKQAFTLQEDPLTDSKDALKDLTRGIEKWNGLIKALNSTIKNENLRNPYFSNDGLTDVAQKLHIAFESLKKVVSSFETYGVNNVVGFDQAENAQALIGDLIKTYEVRSNREDSLKRNFISPLSDFKNAIKGLDDVLAVRNATRRNDEKNQKDNAQLGFKTKNTIDEPEDSVEGLASKAEAISKNYLELGTLINRYLEQISEMGELEGDVVAGLMEKLSASENIVKFMRTFDLSQDVTKMLDGGEKRIARMNVYQANAAKEFTNWIAEYDALSDEALNG